MSLYSYSLSNFLTKFDFVYLHLFFSAPKTNFTGDQPCSLSQDSQTWAPNVGLCPTSKQRADKKQRGDLSELVAAVKWLTYHCFWPWTIECALHLLPALNLEARWESFHFMEGGAKISSRRERAQMRQQCRAGKKRENSS